MEKAKVNQDKVMSSHVVEDSISILLIGKTGAGKTTTSKLISLRKHLEITSDTYDSTTASEIYFSNFKGREITVLDTPGLGDIKLKNRSIVEKTIINITSAIDMNPKGYHAIIFVVKLGTNFITDDINAITLLKHIFGKSVLQKHGILLFTGGDAFEKNASDENNSFEQWLGRQSETNLKLIMEEFGNRALLYDNLVKEERLKRKQIQSLIEIIDSLTQDGRRYTKETFENAEQDRDALLEALKTPYIKDNNLDKIKYIRNRMNAIKINHTNYDDMHLGLKNLERDAQLIYISLQEDDKINEQLEAAIKAMERLIKIIQRKINTINFKFFKAVKKHEQITEIESFVAVLEREREIKLQKEREEIQRIRQIEEEKRKAMKEEEQRRRLEIQREEEIKRRQAEAEREEEERRRRQNRNQSWREWFVSFF